MMALVYTPNIWEAEVGCVLGASLHSTVRSRRVWDTE